MKTIINIIISVVIGSIVFAGTMYLCNGPLGNGLAQTAENDTNIVASDRSQQNSYKILSNEIFVINAESAITLSEGPEEVYKNMSYVGMIMPVESQYPSNIMVKQFNAETELYTQILPDVDYVYDSLTGRLCIFNVNGNILISAI